MIFKALLRGVLQTWQYKRIVVLLYLMTFVLAAFIAYPLKSLLEAKAGHSMMVGDLIKGFDYTFLNDFNNAYGVGFLPIIDQSVIILIIFILLFVFLVGGIVETFLKEAKGYDGAIFWGQSAFYFWRILRLTFYFLLIHALILIIFGFIFYISVGSLSPFELESEATIAFALKLIAPVYILIAVFFFMLQDYTKIILIQTEKKWVFQAFGKAFQFIRQNFMATYGLYLLNILVWLLIIGLNYWLSNLIEFKNGTAIFGSFLISQLFVFSRLSAKLINIASAIYLYSEKEASANEPS